MTDTRDQTEAFAAAVLSVPGVACLKPGITRLLRGARSVPDRADLAGLKVTTAADTLRIEAQIIVSGSRPVIDITREVRAALLARASTGAEVTVTVTGTL